MTASKDRLSYTCVVEKSLKPGGHLIVATVAPDGPKKCSGLDIVRYSPDELRGEFGDTFQLIESVDEAHQTPFGTEQSFIYCHFQKT
jgi:hypothetical protein